MPPVFLPLDKVEKCDTCGDVGNLRLCSQCAERAYCSTECQKRDWKTHKATCKTDRIDLTSYYPILACIAESMRVLSHEIHPALVHRVINSPNPDASVGTLPDGSQARIVKLGLPAHGGGSGSDWNQDFSDWWPTGQSPAVRAKLMRRIAREGNVLPIVTATCLSIMLALYSTTTAGASPEEAHRVRLRYRSSPISDFGVVAGAARVTPEDQLAYILPDKSIIKGQDPNDHYWVYFRTQKGEEVLLDCSMFTFNMCLVAHTRPYLTQSLLRRLPSLVPVWFKDRIMTRGLANADPLLMERRRFSVLRDKSIQKAFEKVVIETSGDLRIADEALDAFVSFMSRVARKPITERERQYLVKSFVEGTNIILDTAIRTDKWKNFPAQPQMGIETDPGEVID